MAKLVSFTQISLDGYFTDRDGDMSFAYNHAPDPEWDAFVAGNASGGGMLIFGRVTYEMMASFWPTQAAAERMPAVAAGMNAMPKLVFSRSLRKLDWRGSEIAGHDLADEIRRRKTGDGPDMAILGSGSIIAQLTTKGLIDEYQIVIVPVALGGGRTIFDGLDPPARLRRTEFRAFGNGNVFLRYQPL